MVYNIYSIIFFPSNDQQLHGFYGWWLTCDSSEGEREEKNQNDVIVFLRELSHTARLNLCRDIFVRSVGSEQKLLGEEHNSN